MDLARIIYPDWLAELPTSKDIPTPITTERELRDAVGSDHVSVYLSADIQLTAPLIVSGYNVRIAGEGKVIKAPATSANRLMELDGASRVEFSNLILDANQPRNDLMIAVVANDAENIAFRDCTVKNYGRIGMRFSANNSRITIDGCTINGGGTNIYHGVGVSDDGPNDTFVIAESTLQNNGVQTLEYGLDFHGDNLILCDNVVRDNGRCVKFPDARGVWAYGNMLAEGPRGDLGAIFIYKGKLHVPSDINIFDNSIHATSAHIRYQHGATVSWMGNRTYRIGQEVEEKIITGTGGGTLTRDDPRVLEFMATQGGELPPVEPPGPPDDIVDVIMGLISALDDRLDALPGAVADELARRLAG